MYTFISDLPSSMCLYLTFPRVKESTKDSDHERGSFDNLIVGTGSGADLGGGCRGCTPPPLLRDDLRFSNTTGILQKKSYVVYLC